MDAVIHLLRRAVELLLAPFDLLPPWLGLLAIAVLTAVMMLVLIKRLSPQRLTQRARDRMAAAVYEMRLFIDAPGRIVRAQGRLIGWMFVYLATLLPAMVVLGPPLGLLYLHLEVRHGLAPIETPGVLVARIELSPGVDGHALTIVPAGPITVTAPLVFDEDERVVYARLRIAEPGTHELTIQVDGSSVTKQLVAGPGDAAVTPDRVSGVAGLWSLGDESPLEGDAIQAISIPHPVAPQSWLGLGIPWWLYWLGASTVFALLLRRRFDVEL